MEGERCTGIRGERGRKRNRQRERQNEREAY